MHIFNNLEVIVISWKALNSPFSASQIIYVFYKQKHKFRIYKNLLKKCIDLRDFTDEFYQTSRQELTTFLHNLFQKIEQKGTFSHFIKTISLSFPSQPDCVCTRFIYLILIDLKVLKKY